MNWKYRDIIDAEFFFHLDRKKNWQELHKRDRALFLKQMPTGEKEDSPKLLSVWLADQRNRQFTDKDSIGTIISKSLSRTHFILLVISFLVGISATTTFLHYSGTTPINLFAFIIIFIGSQLITMAVVLLFRLFSYFSHRQRPQLCPPLIRYTVARVTSLLANPLLSQLTAEQRLSYQYVQGLLQQKKAYSADLSYLFIRIHQSAAISLNLGLLLGSLYKITTADIAFGWQSTLKLSNQYIHTMVEVASLPWNWCTLLAHTNPTLEQIAGSRIILKDGIYHLTNQDLSSWWPFLILCLLTYGLLPRILLFSLALLQEKRSLKEVTKRSADYQKLIQRMCTPIYEQKSEKQPEQTDETIDYGNQPPGTNDIQPQIISSTAVTVLIPTDIRTRQNDTIIESWLQGHGYHAKTLITFMADYACDQQIAEKLSLQSKENQCPVLIVMEANMVPLTEFLSYIQVVRAKTEAVVEILLVKSSENSSLTTPLETEVLLWQQKITGLGDSFIRLFPITFAQEKR